EFDKLGQGQLVFLELTNSERGAIDRERGRNHVDTRAIGKARVAYGRGFVDAAADLGDDALAHIHQMGVIAKAHIGELYLARYFDVAALGAIDHDIGDVVARQKRLERTIAQHVVADVVEQ